MILFDYFYIKVYWRTVSECQVRLQMRACVRACDIVRMDVIMYVAWHI